VAFLFTPGILPSALRAGFAVRAAPAAQWLPFSLATQRESNSGAMGARKLFAPNQSNNSKSIAR
jgi:hypothetical protein